MYGDRASDHITPNPRARGKMTDVATLTPSFPEFLPPWLVRQPWYDGPGASAPRLVGTFRFEDPDGEVGMETHLLSDGSAVYQVPMTYRGAPLADGALIATAEHSELGQRWIYDAESDPVWRAELLRLVRDGDRGDGERGDEGEGGGGEGGLSDMRRVRVYGVPLRPMPATTSIELIRVLKPSDEPAVAGMVMGTWYPDAQESVTGCLAIVRAA
jgi:hypothetical protein